MTQLNPLSNGTYRPYYSKCFRYSALMIGVCTSILTMNSHAELNVDGHQVNANQINRDAQIATAIDKTTYAESNTNVNLKSLGTADPTPDLTPNQLEQTLIALRLKNAVEMGKIDPSVLKAYQEETLKKIFESQPNTPIMTQDSSNNSDESVLDVEDMSEEPNTYNNPNGVGNSIKSSADDTVTITNAKRQPAISDGSDIDGLYDKSGADDDFEQAWHNARVSPIDIAMDISSFDSPEHIEQLLADFDASNEHEFSAPISRLDNNVAPLGLDTSLDVNTDQVSTKIASDDALYQSVSKQIEKQIQQDTNAKVVRTLDDDLDSDKGSTTQSRQVASNEPALSHPNAIASKTASTGNVANNEDITNSSHPNYIADTDNTDNKVTAERINANSTVNPDKYLPEYEAIDTEDAQAQALDNSLEASVEANKDTAMQEGFFKRLYNRLFNEGVSGLPRISATVYIQDDSQVTQAGRPVLIKADTNAQPMNNIKAAIENITAEAIKDFPAVAPRLNEEALSAARAVGYYDIDLHFEQVSAGEINIIIERLGKPVLVQNRVVDVRGEGENLKAFNDVENNAIPLEDDILNHDAYKNTKIVIDSISDSYGFFDGEWLNTSVDVILPDNTADIDVIYQTGPRYEFGDVIFYTYDKELGKLTQEVDKLPVNLELLEQLYAFESGEAYYNPLITEFTNDLSATQYFNMVNVDVILPSDADATLSVVNEPVANESPDNEPVDDSSVINPQEAASENTDLQAQNIVTDEQARQQSNATQADDQSDNQADGEPLIGNDNNQQNTDDDIEPIQFDIDEQTADKLRAIKAKARRLSVLPDDRVLDAQEQEAKNLLGKISNAISNVVKKILPDESDSLTEVDESFEAPTLEGKITPQEVQQSKRVPIYVFVMADKPRDAQIGFGYGTDTGLRMVGQLQHNLLTKDGYQAGIRVGASEIRKTVNVEVSRPWEHPLDDTVHANLAYEQELINQGKGNLDLRTDTIKARLARNIRPPSGWDRTYSLSYRLDELESGVEDARRENLPEPFNRRNAKFTQQSLLLGYAMHKVQSDNLTDPTHGFSQFYSLEAGSDSLLTDTNMAILRAKVGTVQSFGEFDKHQIVANLDTGYIWADNFSDVPYNQRFFAGGDRSLRGYDYNSLSALDNGYLVGGQVLALGSVEYNYEFKPNFRGALFADVGNAYDTDFTTETKLGLGAGIRWSSPIGLVRLDVAAGVLENSVPIRLHFFIGSPLY